jgi:hypothetical protein
MTRSTSISSLGTEFDRFLFAPIGEDRNGMLLSVLSALARLDVDPWQEAAKLARLPEKSATRNLVALVASIPGAPLAHLDQGKIAGRLLALLPRGANSTVRSLDTMLGDGAAIDYQGVVCMLACTVLMAFVLGSQFIVENPQTATQADNVRLVEASAAVPQTPPLNPGQSR